MKKLIRIHKEQRTTLYKGLAYFFFSKWQYVRHGVATRLLKISCFEKITVCVIETMLLTLSLVQMNTAQSEVNQPTKHRSI